MNIFAAADTGQPSTTINRASRNRARGVKAALAWTMKASLDVKRFLDSSTLTPGGLPHRQIKPVSRNNVPGHH
ncbi:hypothetical protein, partial [Microlunatus sp. GCM10028923]|uniref:hypothetical protein n=1 Tax=Microlunatus sp. GCM10028923 TaxID=3273400 RepID=UPI003623B080